MKKETAQSFLYGLAFCGQNQQALGGLGQTNRRFEKEFPFSNHFLRAPGFRQPDKMQIL